MSPWGSFLGANPARTPWSPSLWVLSAYQCFFSLSLTASSTSYTPGPCLLDALTPSLWDHVSCSVATQPPPWQQVPWPLPLPALLLGLIPWVCCAFLCGDSIWELFPCVYVSYGVLGFFKQFCRDIICNLRLRGVKSWVTERFKRRAKSKGLCKGKHVLTPADPF